MKQSRLGFVAGFIFAAGLLLSGMAQPQKVIGFLDIFGQWDPSLIFVMIGAIAVYSIGFRIIQKRPTPVLESTWSIPSKSNFSSSLVIGSLIFVIGWGLSGYCPGPAITGLGSLETRPLLFVVSMFFGMQMFKFYRSI